MRNKSEGDRIDLYERASKDPRLARRLGRKQGLPLKDAKTRKRHFGNTAEQLKRFRNQRKGVLDRLDQKHSRQ